MSNAEIINELIENIAKNEVFGKSVLSMEYYLLEEHIPEAINYWEYTLVEDCNLNTDNANNIAWDIINRIKSVYIIKLDIEGL